MTEIYFVAIEEIGNLGPSVGRASFSGEGVFSLYPPWSSYVFVCTPVFFSRYYSQDTKYLTEDPVSKYSTFIGTGGYNFILWILEDMIHPIRIHYSYFFDAQIMLHLIRSFITAPISFL